MPFYILRIENDLISIPLIKNMVVISKILPLLAAGVGLFFLVNAITRPAHAQQTAGALTSTLGSVGAAGSAISQLGRGVGSGLAGLFQPVWEVANLFQRFSNLASGSANVSPVAQESGGGGGSPTWTLTSGQQATPGSIYDVGGSNIRTTTIGWDTPVSIPLSEEARKWYKEIGVDVS
jgi:hypothetical protein